MRILVISDIHANLSAFKAVLEDADGRWDKIWFLGDLVGYGPDPNECTALLREHDHVALSGNHDWAILGKLDISTFNDYARDAVLWARDIITDETREYLDSLPPHMDDVHESFTLAHASPRQPVWEYILDRGTASVNFDHFDTPYCLVGHTHVPVVFERQGKRTHINQPRYGEPFHLDGRSRCIINPGSVGQPRDSDARAAYALLDLEQMTWEYQRVDYPIKQTQERMREEGLADKLIMRLQFGW